MKKFTYRLESLLKFQKNEEKKAIEELDAISRIVDALTQDIENLIKEQLDSQKFLQEESKKSLQIESIQDFLHYAQYLQGLIAKKQEERMRQQNKMAEKQRRVWEARKKTKVLENLKDQKRADWKEEVEKLETLFLDDLALSRYIRGKNIEISD